MSIFALLSLFASLVSLFIGTYILAKNFNDKKNRSYFYLAFITGILALIEFQFRTSENIETAKFWYKAMGIWPLCISLGYNFIVDYINTKNKILLRIIVPIVNASALGIIFIFLFTDILSSDPILATWGWKTVVKPGLGTLLTSIWASLVSFFTLFLAFRNYLNNKEPIKKKQSYYIFVGYLIFVLISIFNYSLFPSFKKPVPELTTMASILGYVVIAFAIYKYKLFSLTPETISKQIVETISGSLILTDRIGNIVFFNQLTEEIFEVNEKELYQKPVKTFYKDENLDKSLDKLTTNLKFNETYKSPKTNKETELIVNRICIRDQYKNIQGFVYLANDITNISSLRRAKSIAQQSGQLKTDFIQSLYSEISKPLNLLLNQAESLITSKLPEYDTQKYLESISNKSLELNIFISKILDIVKIDNKQVNVSVENVNLNALIDELYNNTVERIKNKRRIKFISEKPLYEGEANIKTDNILLARILEIFIEIILDFTKSGQIKSGYLISEDDFVYCYASSNNFNLTDINLSRVLNSINNFDYEKLRTQGKYGLNFAIIKEYAKIIKGEILSESLKDEFKLTIKINRNFN